MKTPLHVACYSGHETIVAMLLCHGSGLDLDKRDKFRKVSLCCGTRLQLHVLLSLWVGNPTRLRCGAQYTPRDWAVKNKHAGVACLLDNFEKMGEKEFIEKYNVRLTEERQEENSSVGRGEDVNAERATMHSVGCPMGAS